jgi:hypothetical protein
MNDQSSIPSKDTTIYQYRLLKKVSYSFIITLGYIMMLVPFLLANALYSLRISKTLLPLWSVIIAYPSILLIHAIVIIIYLQLSRNYGLNSWSFRIGIFWHGYLPKGHYSLRTHRTIQRHQYWVSCLLLLSLHPWIPFITWMDLLLIHIWTMLPRIIILSKFQQIPTNSLLLISHKDTSCYQA